MTQLHADDGFLEYYQLEHDPFLGRGPSFKFFASKRRSVLVELHHLARYSKLMLVVTGPQGSGKTVLRQALVASSKEPVASVVIAASVNADAASMLQQVSAALNLPNADISGVLRHIEQLLITGQAVHVIVDNAECLDESALLFLQRLAQGVNDASARVFLFSDSTICPLLKKVADDADLHHVIALEPWSVQEVNEYLEQRLSAAGQQLDVFTEQQLADVYAESQGWPGQVNSVAKNLLLESMRPTTQARRSGFTIPLKHLLLLVLLGIGLTFAWFMQTSAPESDATVVSIDSGVIEPAVIPAEAVIDQAKTVTVDLPLDKPIEPVMREPLAQAMSVEGEEQFLTDAELTDAEQPIQASAAEPSSPVLVSAPVPIGAPKPISMPAVESAKTRLNDKEKPVQTAQKTVQSSPPVVKKPAKPVAAKLSPGASILAGSVGDSQWYKQQATSRYTLQVLGTRSESTALAFVKQNSQYHYFRKIHQGQALFVVTYGSFADRVAAQVAINNLPEKIRKDKPWPRTFLSIQQELR